MKSILLALTLPVTVAAQQPGAAHGLPADIRRAVTALEQRIGQANFDCDYKFFAQAEAEEFIFTDGAGGLTTRAEDLAGERSCTPHTGSYVLDEVRVSVYRDVVRSESPRKRVRRDWYRSRRDRRQQSPA